MGDNGISNLNLEESSSKDIAIIGMAAKFPLADSLEQYWSNIKNGVDCVREIPQPRKKDIEEYLNFKGIDSASIAYNEAAYLQGIDEFDYEFFGISPREANLMDPNQRLFLETAWATIEDSGYTEEKIRGSNIGIYVGFIGESEYKNFIEDVQPSFLSVSVTGNCAPIVASRISYILDLRGPNMIVNTSCSSSLVAVHLACKSILNGECESAIAGGVQTHTTPIRKVTIGIESSDGRAKSFDDESDGTGAGEGVGAVFLKPMNKALRDGDNIYAVIKGSAVNQDGSSIGISAPNPIAQEDVIIRAWRDADINPETISYIETHGTGTKLGDPVEINGITRAFARYTDRKQFCAIGAVKTNIGHLDSAAGIAGLIKAVLSLKNKQIPPSIHFKRPNRNINFCQSPTYFNDRLLPWCVENEPRRCGVSSFGISGTNCHVVLEEAPENKTPTGIQQEIKGDYNLLTISGKTRKALKKLVKEYISFLNIQEEYSLSDICYTSNVIKGQYNYRVAVVGENIIDMVEKLEIINLNGLKSYESKGIYYGSIDTREASQERIPNCSLSEKITDGVQAGIKSKINGDKRETMLSQDTLNNLIPIYLQGGHVQWDTLYSDKKVRKVRLPKHPFEKNQCWLEIPRCNKNKANDCESHSTTDIEVKNRDVLDFSEIEKAIEKVFTKILGHKEIGSLDNFFTMGGDSIYALAVVNSINKEFDIAIEMKEFMEKPTVKDLSEKVMRRIGQKNTEDIFLGEIDRVEEKEYYPVSPAQKRMFILNEVKEKQISYNISSAIQIKGDLDIKRLEKVLSKLIERHESLRTSFEIIGNQIVQKISSKVDFSLEYVESDTSDMDTLIKRFIRPFELNKAPLFRASLINMSDKHYILVTDMHHIISDGTSANILVRELIDLYENKQLKKNPIQYKDFSEWQSHLMKTEHIERQEAYWLKRFSNGNPALDIPLDFPRPENLTSEGDTLYFQIDKELNDSLLKMSVETEITLFMVLFAAYNVLLYRYTGNSNIVVGVAASGRTHADFDNTVGMFVNTLPIMNYLDGEMTFRDLLGKVKKNTLEAYTNQDYPFDVLIEKLDLYENSNRNPLFDTMFIMQNTKKTEMKLESLELSQYKIKEDVCKLDIMMNCFEDEGRINFGINYSVKLFMGETIERLWKDYVAILEGVVKNPHIKISDIYLSKDMLIPQFDPVDIDFRLS
ncbi:condensation domain-containing protein [Wukongibacter sp. M2B1]|uniref:condensation domain-containing protein n=1 Tax=Wukongibacter sp. M2B1 TaxID=3088895 RepID=UPI003D7B9E30